LKEKIKRPVFGKESDEESDKDELAAMMQTFIK
jgi:hypothetical protein